MSKPPQLGDEGDSDGLACFIDYFYPSHTMLTIPMIDNSRLDCKAPGEAGAGSLI